MPNEKSGTGDAKMTRIQPKSWAKVCVGILGAGAFCETTAHAQDTPALAAGHAPSSSSATTAEMSVPAKTTPAAPVTGLQEVVVTARKRAESVQNIPVAVTALSAQQIQRYDLTNLEKVAASTPEFTVTRASNGSGAQLTLRGIGSTATSIGIEQSVAVVADGVYFGQGRVIDEGFFDLAQIEILKGPQSLFFGKNATAGVVSITSADPTSKTEYIARVGYETTAEQAYGEAIVSGPITDKLSIRVAVRGSDEFGGYFTNQATSANNPTFDIATDALTGHPSSPAARNEPGEDQALGRITLKWTPTDHFTATAKVTADRDTTNNNSFNYVPYSCVNGVSQINPNVTCGRSFNVNQIKVPADISATLPYGDSNGDLANVYDSYSGTLNLNYASRKFTVTSISNLNYNDNRFECDCSFVGANGGSTFATERTNFRAYSTELRGLTTFSGPFNVLAGYYYQNTQRRFDQNVVTAGVSDSAAPLPSEQYLAVNKNSSTQGQTQSVYGQLIWTITPQLELTGGARYTYETKHSYFVQPYVNPALSVVFIGDTPLQSRQLFHNASPEATLTYKPTRNVTAYVAYKTGYKSGGFSNSGGQTIGSPFVSDFAFNPETSKGYEAGLKTTLLDRQLRLDLTGYHYKFSNLQVDYFDARTFAFITENAASSVTNGVELAADYAPNQFQGLVLHSSVNYNHAYYGSFTSPCWEGQTPAQGCTLAGPAPTFTPEQNLTGHSTALAPKWTAAFGANYEIPLTSSLSAAVSGDARYNDSFNASAFGNPYARQPSYINLDASFRVHTTDGAWELAVIGRNLSNNLVINGVVDGPGTGSGTGTAAGVRADQIGFAGTPRTVQLQLTWRH